MGRCATVRRWKAAGHPKWGSNDTNGECKGCDADANGEAFHVNPLRKASIHPKRSNLTPGITRPPTSLKEHESGRVAGRVHAVVRRVSISTSLLRITPDGAVRGNQLSCNRWLPPLSYF